MKTNVLPNVGIIGAGRFGSFLLNQLDNLDSFEHTITFYVFDKDRTLADCVVAPHVMTGRSVSLKQLAAKSKIIILAVPNRVFEETCKKLAPFLTKDHIVLDVCSMKGFAVQIMKSVFPKGVQIIGTHPLFGPQSCRTKLHLLSEVGPPLFKIAICNVSAKKKTLDCLINKVLKGFLHLDVIECTPDEHDQQMAISQALTHFIGRTFEKMGINRVTLTTKSFDDLMDIIDLVKGGSPELFEDMETMNPYALRARDEFIEHAQDLHRTLFEKSLEMGEWIKQ